MKINLSLGMQFRTCEKFWESTDSSLVLSQNFSQIQKPHRKILEFDSKANDLSDISNSNDLKNSPSLAEGARGWVKSTSGLSVNNAPKSELQKDNTFFKNAIALTGGIASGKSTACNILKLHRYSIIDTDSIAHNALEQSKDEVVGAFGTEILECDSNDSSADSRKSKINRKKLGAIVFSDKAKLAILESILHPKIRAEVKKQAQKLEAQNILYFIDIPLFFELKARGNGYEIPRSLLIYAPKELQLARMQKRDSLSANEAQNRLSNQMDIEAKRQMADFVIENTGNIRDLQSKIEAFLKQLK